MHTHHIAFDYQEFESESELAPAEAELLARALAATHTAHAPYSGFFVGCAVRLATGEVHTGNNQENAAYPSGLCAERTALFHIGSLGLGAQVRALAVRARSRHAPVSTPPYPCGACRQVMVEYEQIAQTPLTVLLQGEAGPILRLQGVAGKLLPFVFQFQFPGPGAPA
jgi:cytidine deaminase